MFIEMKAEFDKKDGDIIGNMLGWMEQTMSEGLIGKNVVPFIRGPLIDGWEFLSRLRKESSSKTARMLVVKNADYEVVPFDVGPLETMDIVRKYEGGKVRYWFELRTEKSVVVEDRIHMTGFAVRAIVVINGKPERINMVFPCVKNYERMRGRIMDAERIHVEGMDVCSSMVGRAEQERHMLVHNWDEIETNLGLAAKVLPNIKSFVQLAPMVDLNGNPLFSDSIIACLLANAFFSKETVPAFNLLIIGPKRNQKSAAIKFLVKDVMHGSVVSGSSSTGKGWLVSHKEGAEPSKLFSEKRSLMIDEALKFSSTGGGDHRGLILRIKDHFVNHMEILQREEVESRSGVATLRGKMVCSLFAVDNPDSVVLEAMGRGYKIADAAFRRWGYLYMDRLASSVPYMTTMQAHRMMKKRFTALGGVDAVRALLLLSRRKCADWDQNADEVWVKKLKDDLKKEIDACDLLPDYQIINSIQDAELKNLIKEEAKTHVDTEMEDIIQAAWSSTAAMRGWEVHNSYKSFDLVFDDTQRAYAEMIVRELCRGKLKLMFPGIISWIDEHRGIGRKEWGAKRDWR